MDPRENNILCKKYYQNKDKVKPRCFLKLRLKTQTKT